SGAAIVTAGMDGVEVWRAGGRSRRITSAAARGVDVRADGTLLIVGTDGRAWIGKGRPRRLLPGHGLTSAVFSGGGGKIVTSGAGGVEVWNAQTLERMRRLNYPARVLFASFSPDGKRIATASSDTTA